MKRIYFKYLFYLGLIVITILSVVPAPFSQKAEVGDLSFRLDYLFHFAAYFILALFLVLWKRDRIAGRRPLVLLLLFGLFFSSVFEIIQIFLPARVFNPLDVLFNFLGFSICLALQGKIFYSVRLFRK